MKDFRYTEANVWSCAKGFTEHFNPGQCWSHGGGGGGGVTC